MTHKDCIRMAGVVKIEICDARELPAQVAYKRESGLPIEVAGWMTELPFVGNPVLEYTQNSKTEPPITTAELRFKTAHELPVGNWGWVVTTANGERHLLGTREGLSPAVSTDETTGEYSGDANAMEVIVRLSARFLPVKLG